MKWIPLTWVLFVFRRVAVQPCAISPPSAWVAAAQRSLPPQDDALQHSPAEEVALLVWPKAGLSVHTGGGLGVWVVRFGGVGLPALCPTLQRSGGGGGQNGVGAPFSTPPIRGLWPPNASVVRSFAKLGQRPIRLFRPAPPLSRRPRPGSGPPSRGLPGGGGVHQLWLQLSPSIQIFPPFVCFNSSGILAVTLNMASYSGCNSTNNDRRSTSKP